MKKLFKIGAYVVLALIGLVLLLAGATQTQYFRDRLRAYALGKLRETLIAEVALGEVHGNLVTGFAIDSIAITLDGTDIVRADEVGLRYNLLEVPGRVISVSELTLTHPTIRILRDRTGSWNIQRMVRSEPPADSAEKRPFNWSIIVNQFALRHGTVMVVDSTALLAEPPPSDTDLVYKDVRLENVNLSLSARIAPEEMRVTIGSLAFESVRAPFNLHRLAGEFVVTPTQARAENLVITSDRSNLRLNAAMRQVDLLGGITLDSLQHALVDLELHGRDIDFGELKTLLPPVDFLHGAATIDLAATGEFGNLAIQRLDLETGRNHLVARGRIANLHDPGNLQLNIRMGQSQLYGPDVSALMPEFNIPAFAGLGTADLELEFQGKPLDFRTKVLLRTAAGTAQAEGTLVIGGPRTLRYNAQATVEKLNLAPLLEEEQLASTLNGSLRLEGEGVSLQELSSALTVDIAPSEFRGMTVQPSTVSVNAAPGHLEGRCDVAMESMQAHIAATLDAERDEEPRFTVGGNVSSVDLARVLNDPAYNSDLTLILSARGSGLTLGALNGDFHLDFSSSRYREYQLSGGNMHVILNQQDAAAKKLTLQSNIADFTLAGAFDLATLGDLIAFEVDNVRGALREKLAVLDTALSVRRVQTGVRRQTAPETEMAAMAPIDAEYALVLKDLEPLSVMAGERVFNGTGTLSGTLRGGYDDVSIRGRLDLDDFFYGDVSSGMLVQNGSATLVVNHLRPADPLKTMEMRFNVNATTVHLNSTEMDSIDVTFAYQNEEARYSAQGRVDQNLSALLDGEARVAGDSVALRFNDLRWAYQDFAWKAEPGLALAVDRMGLRVENALFRRDSQEVRVAGRLFSDGRVNARLTADRVDLRDLRLVLEPEHHRDRYVGFEGTADIILDASGSVRQPEFTASVNARNVAYGRVPFGPVTGTVDYRNFKLRIDAEGGTPSSSASSTSPAISVSGSVPLRLSALDSTSVPPDSTLNLTIRSEGMQMSILDPLVPTLNQLSGLLRCDLTIAGTPRRPRMHGPLNIADASFLFVPNNIQYTLDGSFRADGDRVNVMECIIRNVPGDVRGGRQGETTITGDFALTNFVPGDFNLTATGQLLVVKETTRQSSLSVYGNLFVEIAPSGLHLTGAIERSLLKGSLFITNSTLIFPPTIASVAEESPLSVPLVFVNDTMKTVEHSLPAASRRYFGSNGNGKKSRQEKAEDDESRSSFVDGIRYDLDIDMAGGNSQIQMVFNPATNEELVAAIEGTFTIAGDGKEWFGDLTVSRAYYNFFKRFDAEGKIRYTGNFANPELEITGRYKGTRVLEDSLQGRTTENIVVTITITGTRFKPKIDMSMTIDETDYFNYAGAKSNDVQSDAISFILAGAFPLSGPERRQVVTDAGIGSSLLTGATSPLTGVLSEFLRSQVGFISSVELNYNPRGESLTQRTDIRLSGTAWNGYWQYGGNILYDPVENANFSILYSFGTIFNNMALRNLMFELERRVEANMFGPSNEFKRVNSARLFYRFSF